MWSDWRERIRENQEIPKRLLWEYDLSNFDWNYMRDVVVQRVIERGRDNDYYAIFRLYGGIKGVREIIKNEVLMLSPKEIAFVCIAFNLKKEELRCYIRKQSREKLLNS